MRNIIASSTRGARIAAAAGVCAAAALAATALPASAASASAAWAPVSAPNVRTADVQEGGPYDTYTDCALDENFYAEAGYTILQPCHNTFTFGWVFYYDDGL